MKENYRKNEFPDAHVDEKYEEIISLKALKYFIIRDYTKKHGNCGMVGFFKVLFLEPGFKFVFWLRITRFLYLKRIMYLLFILSRFILKHYSYKYGFDISYRIPIGPGLSIEHIGYIVIDAFCIGSNCSLRPGVVLGRNLVGGGKTIPTIGDNVQFGVGCKVIGKIKIGNNVLIGANAVVTHDIPSNNVVVGIPAKPLKRLDSIVTL